MNHINNTLEDTEFLALLIIQFGARCISLIILSSISFLMGAFGLTEIQAIDSCILLLTHLIQAAVAIAGGILVHYKWKNRKSNKIK